MNIGKSLYKEITKMATPAMPIYQQSTQFIPMVRLSDLEKFLGTLELQITGGSLDTIEQENSTDE